jgi:hypothetical protein
MEGQNPDSGLVKICVMRVSTARSRTSSSATRSEKQCVRHCATVTLILTVFVRLHFALRFWNHVLTCKENKSII